MIRYEPDLTDIALFQIWEQEAGSSIPIVSTRSDQAWSGAPVKHRSLSDVSTTRTPINSGVRPGVEGDRSANGPRSERRVRGAGVVSLPADRLPGVTDPRRDRQRPPRSAGGVDRSRTNTAATGNGSAARAPAARDDDGQGDRFPDGPTRGRCANGLTQRRLTVQEVGELDDGVGRPPQALSSTVDRNVCNRKTQPVDV